MISSTVARKTLLVVNTLRWLRPRQVLYRIVRRFSRPTPDVRPAPISTVDPVDERPAFVERETTFLGSDRFRFLNRELAVPPDSFSLRKGELLWDYNFHYFDGLFGPEPDDDAKWRWVEAWIQRVPPGNRPGWDPYPISRRLVNWTKWALKTGRSSPHFLDSMAVQARYLDKQFEYHLLANHLLANAVALTAVGALFDGREAERWRKKGERVLIAELREQFLDDGGHFELSPVYHADILEDLLDLIQILVACRVPVPPALRDTASRAAHWLATMVRPDGRLPLFNDSAYGVAPEPNVLAEYAARLGLGAPALAPSGLTVLEPTGYFRYSSDRLFICGDVGQPGPSYQPGHAHCDMLAFELCWDGRPLLVDTGTSTYEPGSRRSLERGTSAHNTVQVGTREQSEVWAAFRVARRAQITERRWSESEVAATIRAFPPAWASHERCWKFDGDSVRVEDRVRMSGASAETCTARFHFHPSVQLSGRDATWTADGVRFVFDGVLSVRTESFDYAPEFNRRWKSSLLTVTFENRLVTRVDAT